MKRLIEKFTRYERLYCFPNRFGFMGFTLFLIMLATAGTYQNNLIFMMAFLFLSLGLIAILQTARNIREIEVVQVRVEPNFPGLETEIVVVLKNLTSDLKLQIEVGLTIEDQKVRLLPVNLGGRDFVECRGRIMLPKTRGIYTVQRIGIYTNFPYTLFTAWKFSKKTAEVVVYPAPRGEELEASPALSQGEDFSGHKIYERGDSQSHIDWRVFARGNQTEFHIRQFKEGGDQELLLEWQKIDSRDFEDKLSQMSRWIVSAEERSLKYEVILPRFHAGAGLGEQHFKACMEALTRTV